MKHRILLCASCALTAMTMAVLATAKDIGLSAPTIGIAAGTPNSCASVHFGMSDSNLMGDINLANADVVSVGEHDGSIGVVSDNIAMTSHEVINQAVNAHETAGLKLSSAKKNSTIALTFDSDICGCTVYAVGWKDKSSYISVNGSDATSIESNSLVTGSSFVSDIKYNPYKFEFASTKTITIAATERVVIGDIAIRLG